MAGQFHLEDGVSTRYLSGRVLTAASDAATTLTGPQTTHGIVTMTPTAARNLTTATAAQIVAAIPDAQVGTCFELTVDNGAAATHAITLVAGDAAVTLPGVAAKATIAAASQATFLGRITNVATPAVTFYRK